MTRNHASVPKELEAQNLKIPHDFLILKVWFHRHGSLSKAIHNSQPTLQGGRVKHRRTNRGKSPQFLLWVSRAYS